MAGVANEPLLKEMLRVTRHRGPNDSGTYVSHGASAASYVAIGNNRLSIIDLSPAGHQPICNEDGTIWVVYNGEIFNFPELRRELAGEGHQFQSRTDTEVLVHLYEKYGTGMVGRLNGMFAFALWDSGSQELFICRDRMGIKPLYYAEVNGRLYFASEIKALLLCPEIEVDVDPVALYQYLACLYVPNPACLFKGIFKLPPGHSLRWSRGQVRVEPYWDLCTKPYSREPEDALAERLKTLLFTTVRRQLISDVPVGFFLSGGLDSSTLVACAAQTHDSTLNCYSIAFKQEHGRLEQCGDDAHYARIVAEHFGAKFNGIVVDPDVVSLLPKVVWHLDNPIADPAAIATYLISEAAAPDVRVLLSGQGADEVFGGYRVHRAYKTAGLLRLIPRKVREDLAPAVLNRLAANKDKALGISPGLVLAFCRFFESMLRTSGSSPQEQYAALRSYLRDEDLRSILSKEANTATAACSHRDAFFRHFEKVKSDDFLNQMLYVDAKTFLPDLNLAYSDKLSMACSIEVRVPFLDNEVVDFMLQLPPRLKIKGFTQKYILRKAMEGVLPKAVLQRRKASFGLPVRSWLASDLHEMVTDLLAEDRVRRRGFFDPAAVTRMIRANRNGDRDYTYQLWSLLTLELWCQTFVDQARPVATERVGV